jgi:hypothetical protein
MDLSLVYMLVGFLLAGYSIVANDAIQTLGTFLSSNNHRPWWILWLFISTIFTIVLVYGYIINSGDVSYGRLEKFPPPEVFTWIYILPPVAIFILTRYGIPVSTTFLVLTVFTATNFEKVLTKSLLGYLVAFVFALIIYLFVTKYFEAKIIKNDSKPKNYWIALQWLSTGFLWSQWLIQDLANIFVYAPASTIFYKIGIDSNQDGTLKDELYRTEIVNFDVDPTTLINQELGEIFVYAGKGISIEWLIGSLVMLWILHGVIFYQKGGKIQNIVTSKTNTLDIRSATLIDFIFGLTLLFFKELSNIPMSTTWVFIGLLAGREISITFILKHRKSGLTEAFKLAGIDLIKVLIGLIISIIIAFGAPELYKLFN